MNILLVLSTINTKSERPAICAAPPAQVPKTTEKAMLKFYEGTISDVEVVVLFSGVCKVNAAIATQILIDTYHVNTIINAGTAGGMNEKLEIFDTVISTEVAYHDVAPNILTEFHPWLETVFFKADQGLLSVAKKAVDKREKSNSLLSGFPCPQSIYVLCQVLPGCGNSCGPYRNAGNYCR